ncbi:DNA-directed RNA polymerase subunit H [Candidatus Woesearchaeota archaeon]|nr:DNA-directed RNA polymerase subunit H [Candidatus Woesearchaeota archaeon]
MVKKKSIDVSKHVLVPKHSKVSEREKVEILKRYNISLVQLPKILADDPALQDLDVNPGDVIKIVRQSQTAMESVFYRCVTNA